MTQEEPMEEIKRFKDHVYLAEIFSAGDQKENSSTQWASNVKREIYIEVSILVIDAFYIFILYLFVLVIIRKVPQQ